MPSGLFISVEGAEGVGKSFFCQSFKQRLKDLGRDLVLTREPGGTVLADKIRELFANPPEAIQSISELFLVSAARSQHVNLVIRPVLAEARWVLSDRFFDSTYVYQGAIGGIDVPVIDAITLLATGGLIPDLTFLLDADVKLTAARLKSRDQSRQDGAKRFDEADEAMRELMRQAYLGLARRWPQRFCILDASLKPDLVVEHAIQYLHDRGYEL